MSRIQSTYASSRLHPSTTASETTSTVTQHSPGTQYLSTETAARRPASAGLVAYSPDEGGSPPDFSTMPEIRASGLGSAGPSASSMADALNSLVSKDSGFAAHADNNAKARQIAVLQTYVAEIKKGGGSDPWSTAASDIKSAIGSGDKSWVDGAISDAKGIISNDPVAKRLDSDGFPEVAGQIAAAKTNLDKFESSQDASRDKGLIDKVANTGGLDPIKLGNYASILGSNTPGIGAKARDKVNGLFTGKTPSSGDINDLFSKGDYLDTYRPLPSGSFVTPTFTKSTNSNNSNTYQVSIAGNKTQVDVSAKGSTSDGKRDLYTFKLRGHTLNVTYPKGADTSGKDGVTKLDTLAQNFAAQTDADLDSASHETFVVSTSNTSSYADTDHSGNIHLYASNGANDVNFTSPAMSHELGHAASFNEASDQDRTDYMGAIKSDGDSPSGYARANADEDFAETWALYQDVVGTSNEATYRNLYPARFALLDRVNAAVRKDGAKTGPASTSD